MRATAAMTLAMRSERLGFSSSESYLSEGVDDGSGGDEWTGMRSFSVSLGFPTSERRAATCEGSTSGAELPKEFLT